jgi:hypothetical protein
MMHADNGAVSTPRPAASQGHPAADAPRALPSPLKTPEAKKFQSPYFPHCVLTRTITDAGAQNSLAS